MKGHLRSAMPRKFVSAMRALHCNTLFVRIVAMTAVIAVTACVLLFLLLLLAFAAIPLYRRRTGACMLVGGLQNTRSRSVPRRVVHLRQLSAFNAMAKTIT